MFDMFQELLVIGSLSYLIGGPIQTLLMGIGLTRIIIGQNDYSSENKMEITNI